MLYNILDWCWRKIFAKESKAGLLNLLSGVLRSSSSYISALSLSSQAAAAREEAEQTRSTAAAERDAAIRRLKAEVQSLQAAVTAAEARADAKEHEAASARETTEAQSSELRAARDEAAAGKKQTIDFIDKITLLDKQMQVRGSATIHSEDATSLLELCEMQGSMCSFIPCSPESLGPCSDVDPGWLTACHGASGSIGEAWAGAESGRGKGDAC